MKRGKQRKGEERRRMECKGKGGKEGRKRERKE